MYHSICMWSCSWSHDAAERASCSLYVGSITALRCVAPSRRATYTRNVSSSHIGLQSQRYWAPWRFVPRPPSPPRALLRPCGSPVQSPSSNPWPESLEHRLSVQYYS